ncbi:SDR family NAD(P)-dependent oxidoreductase [Streptomyces sp. NPDC056638]|uniref:SDR family NAD(P)-dependent oxidoreductase n=1 Tax=Streptomyces sp. NPDC056638 TaxID=3345887 RepID=UPI00368A1854
MSKSVAVVTGTSQGMGRSTAIRLARDSSSIALVARNRTHLEETAAKVREEGAEALVIDLDLSDRAAAATVVGQTRDAFKRIDALVNIAGAVSQIDKFPQQAEIGRYGQPEEIAELMASWSHRRPAGNVSP